MSQVIFVAGATGYTGREVVRQAAADGRRVVAHVRPDSSRLETWRERCAAWGAEVDATPWELEAMTATLTRLAPTAVFSLLGTTASRSRREGRRAIEGYEQIDYGLTVLLLRAAEACGAAPRFVYLSSTGVSDRTRNPYLQARARCERELRASALPWTIARPSFITGPDRDDGRALERVGAAAGDVLLGALGAFGATRTRDRYRSTSNTALAGALLRAASEPACVGQVLEGEDLRGA